MHKRRLSETQRKLAHNFTSLAFLKAVNVLVPLIVLPYSIKVMGLELYGTIVFATSIINYFVPLVDYSFGLTGTREIAKNRHIRKQLSLISSKVYAVKFTLSILAFLMLSILILCIPSLRVNWLLYLTIFPMVVGNALFPDWFFQGIEDMGYISVANVLAKIVATTMIFIFLRTEADYLIYPLSFSVGTIVSGIIGFTVMRRRYQIRIFPVTVSEVTRTIKVNFPVFVNQFFPTLYNNTTTFMLGAIAPKSSVGVYDAVKKIVDLIDVLIGVVSRTVFPHIVLHKNDFDLYRKYMIVGFIPVCIFPVIVHKQLASLLSLGSYDPLPLLLILLPGLYALVIYNVYGTNYFISRGYDKIVMRTTIIASLIGFCCAYPLVSSYGIIGAAINLTLSRVLMSAPLVICARKNHDCDH